MVLDSGSQKSPYPVYGREEVRLTSPTYGSRDLLWEFRRSHPIFHVFFLKVSEGCRWGGGGGGVSSKESVRKRMKTKGPMEEPSHHGVSTLENRGHENKGRPTSLRMNQTFPRGLLKL